MFNVLFSFKWILFLSKMWKHYNWKLYPTTFWEKSPTSKSAQCCHYIQTDPWIFTVNQQEGVYEMAALCWNGVCKTHGNLAGLSRSDRWVSFSKWMHNLKWLRIRHLHYILDAIWTCRCHMNLHSIYWQLQRFCFSTTILSFRIRWFKVL